MKAVIFDFDGVFTDKSSAVRFMKYLTKEGIFEKDSLMKIKKALEEYFDGEKSYQETNEVVGREWLKGIEGKSEERVKKKAKEFVDKFEYDEIGKEVVEYFRDRGYSTILMSSSPIEIIKLIGDKLGFDEVVATGTSVKDGKFIKNTEINTIAENSKADYIKNNLEELDLENSYGFGDTVHDLSFLNLVGNPVVINSGREMEKELKKREWDSYPDLESYLEVLKE